MRRLRPVSATLDKVNSWAFRVSAALSFSLVLLLCLPSRTEFQCGAAAPFATKCAICHDANGEDNTAVGKSLTFRDSRSRGGDKHTDAPLTHHGVLSRRASAGLSG